MVSRPATYQDFLLDVACTLSRSAWDRHNILLRLKYLAEKWGMRFGDVAMVCRIAMTGTTVSEPVDELLSVVDKEKALEALLRFRESCAV